MKLSRYKLLLVFPALVLSSCGYGLKETYKGVPYNSTVFTENYYNVWTKEINPYSSSNKINSIDSVYTLNDSDDMFVDFNSQQFRKCEDRWDSYDYKTDLEVNRAKDNTKILYGQDVKLSAIDDSFKYGVESKLFDGQLFCNGYFQNSRVQVEPINQGEQKGFGVLFKKECARASYFMMNFKASITNLDGSYNGIATNQISEVKLNINFYIKNDQGYRCMPITCVVDNVKTNLSPEDHLQYTCFGFKLNNLFPNLEQTRIAGFSVQYERVNVQANTLHALMLYEVSFPHSTWH